MDRYTFDVRIVLVVLAFIALAVFFVLVTRMRFREAREHRARLDAGLEEPPYKVIARWFRKSR